MRDLGWLIAGVASKSRATKRRDDMMMMARLAT
jgi:hypothetical protein